MVTGRNTVFGCATNFLQGRKCIFCSSFKINKTARGYVKRHLYGKQPKNFLSGTRKRLSKLRREIAILQ